MAGDPPPASRPAGPAPAFNVRPAFGLLQEIIGRVDAMLYATERHFERWRCGVTGVAGELDAPRIAIARLTSSRPPTVAAYDCEDWSGSDPPSPDREPAARVAETERAPARSRGNSMTAR